MKYEWLKLAQELQAIAQTGLTYSKDVYDRERFEQIREISVRIMSDFTGTDMAVVRELFAHETGYATPKVDVRAVVFQGGRLLMVREKMDGAWSLPGGWADIGCTPSEVAVKETREEAGFEVRPVRLLAVLDKKRHPHSPSPSYIYKIFIQCEIVGGAATAGLETSDVRFFADNELPKLSVDRNTESQIRLMFEYGRDPDKPAICD
ncbi:ADP-ribose pyrophosphatase [Gordoniibacillus kamchatkensis]|uniref:ADP-ribose pyrophosphatase n=1 Tax=Gordoniibacillus kamchatkensis TaxID=1590651 RepID=A0ABR5AEG3_9BACL|nr:NUDIX hydrolase [Paenibacillus sp. VKM B-2647]KIL39449.1 ADP-ribose pyrophosphatase [Paenibacillus sp. VKM B-2647]